MRETGVWLEYTVIWTNTRHVFSELVVDPALSAATGLERLQQLAERFLQHVEDDVFPGGCEDPVQLAFEIDAFLVLANVNYVIARTPELVDRARHAVRARLALAAPRMDAMPDAAGGVPTKN
jgi:hypothetical protein